LCGGLGVYLFARKKEEKAMPASYEKNSRVDTVNLSSVKLVCGGLVT
jgi:hypothetical protein